MWIGLFSDIHANREALEASLQHARGSGVGRFIFLGDHVGYGADPCFAVDTVMREVEHGAVALQGNHDAAIFNGTGGMNSIAAEAIKWTWPRLDTAQREFLTQLPLTFEEGNKLFVHASAHAPERWEYVTDVSAASRSFMATRAQATFCGHVHIPELFHLSKTGNLSEFEPRRTLKFRCSRKGAGSLSSALSDNRAITIRPPATAHSIRKRNVLVYVRVPYDSETAARKVRDAGLPSILGDRLIEGV